MAFFDKFKGKKKNTEEVQAFQPEEVSSDELELEIEEQEDPDIQIGAEIKDRSDINEKSPEANHHTLEPVEEKVDGSEDLQPAPEDTDTEEAEAEETRVSEKVGIFERFKKGLSKTRQNISGKIDTLVKSTRKLDDEFFEELEDILIQADVGMNTSIELVKNIRHSAKKNKINDPEAVKALIQDEISQIMGHEQKPLNIMDGELTIIMVVGVNGAGKTTTIAKLANRFKKEHKKVILAAGDTFRAAAIDQLQIWADRVGVELIKHQEGADPGAVVFDAISAARARKADILIIDTAGRLQNKTNLMKEISKVRKVIEKEIPQAPHEVLLLLDATTGQNAISQAKIFGEATGVTGIVLSKLDGTAKGGIVIAVNKELDIPVKLIGIGEGIEDLRDFSPDLFAQALFAE